MKYLGLSSPGERFFFEKFVKPSGLPSYILNVRSQIVSKISQILGKKLEIDLFSSRLSNQLPSYYPWKPNPNGLGTDAFQQKCCHKSLYAFPSFALIQKVLKKVEEEKVTSLIIVTPAWQTQT